MTIFGQIQSDDELTAANVTAGGASAGAVQTRAAAGHIESNNQIRINGTVIEVYDTDGNLVAEIGAGSNGSGVHAPDSAVGLVGDSLVLNVPQALDGHIPIIVGDEGGVGFFDAGLLINSEFAASATNDISPVSNSPTWDTIVSVTTTSELTAGTYTFLAGFHLDWSGGFFGGVDLQVRLVRDPGGADEVIGTHNITGYTGDDWYSIPASIASVTLPVDTYELQITETGGLGSGNVLGSTEASVMKFAEIGGAGPVASTVYDYLYDSGDTLNAAITTGAALGDFIETASYHEVGAASANPLGGGNLYLVVASGTGTDDGGSYIDVPAGGAHGARQLKAMFGNRVNVDQFGAKRNEGSFDCSTHVQAAVDYLESLTDGGDYGVGGVINYSGGDYRQLSEIIVNGHGITFSGEGRTATRVVTDSASANAFYFGAADAQSASVDGRLLGGGVQHLTVHNLEDNPTDGAAIYLNRAAQVVVRDVFLSNYYQGVVFAGTGADCALLETRITAGRTAASAGFAAGSTGVRITRAQTASANALGALDPEDGLYYDGSDSVFITDVNIRNTDGKNGYEYCIDVDAVDGLYFMNSHLGNARNALMRFRPSQENEAIHNVSIGNVFFDGKDTDIGLHFEPNTDINENVITSVLVGDTWFGNFDEHGIKIERGASVSPPERVRFSNCEVKSTDLQAIVVEAGDYISFDHFDIFSTNLDVAASAAASAAMVEITGGNHVAFRNSQFRSGGRGVTISDASETAEYITIADNDFGNMTGEVIYNDNCASASTFVINSNTHRGQDDMGNVWETQQVTMHSPSGERWSQRVDDSGIISTWSDTGASVGPYFYDGGPITVPVSAATATEGGLAFDNTGGGVLKVGDGTAARAYVGWWFDTDAPTADDDVSGTGGNPPFNNGTLWLKTSNPRTVYVLVNHGVGGAVWEELGGGAIVLPNSSPSNGGELGWNANQDRLQMGDGNQSRAFVPVYWTNRDPDQYDDGSGNSSEGTDMRFSMGTIWINTSSGGAFVSIGQGASAAVWEDIISGGGGTAKAPVRNTNSAWTLANSDEDNLTIVEAGASVTVPTGLTGDVWNFMQEDAGTGFQLVASGTTLIAPNGLQAAGQGSVIGLVRMPSPSSDTFLVVGDAGSFAAGGVATTASAGIIELATQAEVDGGTDATRAVTPDTLQGLDPTNMGWVVDEDDMTSDSATLLPTQQSVKAYVDNNLPGEATASERGIVELANTAETQTATDLTLAVTPGGLGALANVGNMGWVLDEDDMSSDSALQVPTQQSVKAYVDANAGGSIEQDVVFTGDSDLTASAGAPGQLYVFSDTMTVDRTITLPDAATAGDGYFIHFKNDDTVQSGIVSRAGSDTFSNGNVSKTIPPAGIMTVFCDGTQWFAMREPEASVVSMGVVQLATTAEAEAASDTTKVVVPSALGGIDDLSNMSWFVDEDDMSSDSAVLAPSQQSVKAYADNVPGWKIKHSASATPGVNNDGVDTAGLGTSFEQGDLWFNTNGNVYWACYGNSTGAANWRQIADTAATNFLIGLHAAISDDVHGVGASSSVVGTETTQTLENKTIDGSPGGNNTVYAESGKAWFYAKDLSFQTASERNITFGQVRTFTIRCAAGAHSETGGIWSPTGHTSRSSVTIDSLTLVWCTESAGNGTVRWACDFFLLDPSSGAAPTTTIGSTQIAEVDADGNAADGPIETTFTPSSTVTVADDELLQWEITREGDHANDDDTTNVSIVGLWVNYSA